MAVNLEKWGVLGVKRLKDATPVDTGELRDGWHYAIKNGAVVFYNDRPDIVRYLCNGHMTTAGTWVQGNDFVTPIVREIQNEIRKETLSDGRRLLRRERKRLKSATERIRRVRSHDKALDKGAF